MKLTLLTGVMLLALSASAHAKHHIQALCCAGETMIAHTLIVGRCSFTGPQAAQVYAKCKEDDICTINAYGWDNGHNIFIITRIASAKEVACYYDGE
jgi:hypothetical protein